MQHKKRGMEQLQARNQGLKTQYRCQYLPMILVSMMAILAPNIDNIGPIPPNNI